MNGCMGGGGFNEGGRGEISFNRRVSRAREPPGCKHAKGPVVSLNGF